MIADPRDTIADSPMSPLQVMVVAITVALNALDGSTSSHQFARLHRAECGIAAPSSLGCR